MKIKKILGIAAPIASGISSSIVPLIAGAQSSGAAGSLPTPITSVSGISNLLCRVFGWMFWGLIVISMIMIVWGAFLYVTAADDTEKVSSARKTLMYAAIGIAVALVAKAVPTIVGGLLGTSTAISAC